MTYTVSVSVKNDDTGQTKGVRSEPIERKDIMKTLVYFTAAVEDTLNEEPW